MSWIQRYRLRNAIRPALWIAPLLSMVLALIIHRFLWQGNGWTSWTLLGFQPNGARGVLGAISNSTLTFIVFVFSVLLLVVQIASTNLSPRVIAIVFKSYPTKTALAMFLFTYIGAIGVLGRIEDTVPQLEVLLTIFFTLVSLAAFLYLIDYTGKGLHPVSVVARVANDGYRVIARMYPRLLTESSPAAEVHAVQAAEQPRVIRHVGTSGVFLAFDAEGLMALARRAECVIRVVPQVGEFVAVGAPLFHVYRNGGSPIAERILHRAVAFGPERTMDQDPLFAFRILVDIAAKALSPAINDPTTAVVAIDQIHHLLHQVGPSAYSSSLVGNRPMRFMRASRIGTHALGHLLRRQHVGRVDHGAFPMGPLRLERVQPGAFTRQPARDEAPAPARLCDVAVMRTQPRPSSPAFVPRGVIPHQQQGVRAQHGQAVAAPRPKRERQRTHRLTHGKSAPELFRRHSGGAQQQARAGPGRGLGIIVGRRVFDRTQRALGRRPGGHRRLGQATPPDFIAEAEHPFGMGRRQADEPVALVLPPAYAGSGLVIQCLARFRRVWSAARAWRIASPLTRRGVIPMAYATSAAKSRVQRLGGLPKVRGLWWSIARSCSRRADGKPACGV
jgi:uncharacterized membrane protein